MKLLRRLYRYLIPYKAWAILAFGSMIVVAASQGALMALIRPLFDEVLTAQEKSARTDDDRASIGALKKAGGSKGSSNAVSDLVLRRNIPEGARGPIINAADNLSRPARQWWQQNENERWKMILGMLLIVFVIRAITTFFSEYSFQKVGLSTVRDLRNELYEKIIGQSHRFFSQRSTGELVSRVVSDADAIQAAVSVRMGDLFQETTTLMVLAIFVFVSNPELALISFVIAPVIVVPVVQFGKRLRKTTHQSQERMATIATLLEETIRGVRIVKAFTMEKFEMTRFQAATKKHLSSNLRAQKIQALSSPVMELLAGILIVLLLSYAAVRIRSGELTLGQFLSFVFALAAMYAPVKRLNKVNLAMNTALSAAERVFSMLDIDNEVKDKANATNLSSIGNGIRYENVSFTYGEGAILKGVSLDIAPGEMVAVVGGSGAGKSTMVNLLPRFYDVTEGRITVAGTDIRDVTMLSLRSLMGFVTQEVVLFNDTVRNNIGYGRADISMDRIVDAARAANAADFIDALPNGYETIVGESGVLLSGGQRQRLAIARALLKNPPILVLDEATSALDTESERLVQQALANLMRGRTTLVIAHRLSTIRRADKIIVLDKGQIAESGTHDELLSKRGIYNKLYEMQFAHDEPLTEVIL